MSSKKMKRTSLKTHKFSAKSQGSRRSQVADHKDYVVYVIEYQIQYLVLFYQGHYHVITYFSVYYVRRLEVFQY